MLSGHALIIDDRKINIDVLGMLLAQQGLTYTAVELPQRLIETLDQLGKVDVVFIDLEFPSGNGLDVFHTLKADSRLHGVPLVAYTVHTYAMNEARDAGFHSFLGKPLSAKDFPNQLKRILNHEPVWEA